jgi:hypothetical protein
MQTTTAENQTAPRAPHANGETAAYLPLLDGTNVIVTEQAKEELADTYGVTGAKIVNGEVVCWIEGRIVTGLGKILQRSANYVSLKDVLACWIYDLRNLMEDADQVFILKDGDPRNLLDSNIGVSPRRPEYL